MNELVSQSETINRVFQLCYAIIQERSRALEVALEVMRAWPTYHAKESKRIYYEPRSSKPRNKIIFEKPAELQRLIYTMTVDHELQQERECLAGEGSIHEETLLLRYVKTLLQHSLDRSFKVSVALCRVLHNYSLAETKRIYGFIMQRNQVIQIDQTPLADGDTRYKDDDYYRQYKNKLMDVLEARFDGFYKTSLVKGTRTERRFESYTDPQRLLTFVKKCLRLFTPWNTQHILPKDLDVTKFQIEQLKFEGVYRDNEHPIEVNRIHTLIDPFCFSRVIAGFGYLPLEERIEIPILSKLGNTHRDDPPPIDLDNLPGLTDSEKVSIMDQLMAESYRRKHSFSDSLLILVDGVERKILPLLEVDNTSLKIDLDARMIQVVARQGRNETLLSTLLLNQTSVMDGRQWKSRLTLEGGQKIIITIKPSFDLTGQIDSLFTQIAYKETHPLRFALLFGKRINSRLSVRRVPGLAVAGSGLSVLIVTLVLVAHSLLPVNFVSKLISGTDRSNEKPEQNQNPSAPQENAQQTMKTVGVPSPLPSNGSDGSKGNNKTGSPSGWEAQNRRVQSSPKKNLKSKPIAEKHDVASKREPTSADNDQGNATRVIKQKIVGLTLQEIRTVFVDPIVSPFGPEIQKALIHDLKSGNRISYEPNRNRADSLMQIVIVRSRFGWRITGRLYNVAGGELWKKTVTISGQNKQNKEEIANEAAKRLLSDVLGGAP